MPWLKDEFSESPSGPDRWVVTDEWLVRVHGHVRTQKYAPTRSHLPLPENELFTTGRRVSVMFNKDGKNIEEDNWQRGTSSKERAKLKEMGSWRGYTFIERTREGGEPQKQDGPASSQQCPGAAKVNRGDSPQEPQDLPVGTSAAYDPWNDTTWVEDMSEEEAVEGFNRLMEQMRRLGRWGPQSSAVGNEGEPSTSASNAEPSTRGYRRGGPAQRGRDAMRTPRDDEGWEMLGP